METDKSCGWICSHPTLNGHLLVTRLLRREKTIPESEIWGHFKNHLVQQTRQWFNFTAKATKVQKARIDFLKVMHKSWKRSQIGRLKWWVCKAVNTKAVVSLCVWRISAYQWENSRLSLSSVNCGWSDWSRGIWIQWKEEGGDLWTGRDNCMKDPV